MNAAGFPYAFRTNATTKTACSVLCGPPLSTSPSLALALQEWVWLLWPSASAPTPGGEGFGEPWQASSYCTVSLMKHMTSPGFLTLRSCLPTCDIHPRHRALSQGPLPCLRACQAWSVSVLSSRLVASNTFVKGIGYVLNAISWVSGFVVGAGVIITGIAADRGQRWAAGNRSYTPIHDHRRHRSYSSIQGYGTNA
jgi:hypothetical protein